MPTKPDESEEDWASRSWYQLLKPALVNDESLAMTAAGLYAYIIDLIKSDDPADRERAVDALKPGICTAFHFSPERKACFKYFQLVLSGNTPPDLDLLNVLTNNYARSLGHMKKFSRKQKKLSKADKSRAAKSKK